MFKLTLKLIDQKAETTLVSQFHLGQVFLDWTRGTETTYLKVDRVETFTLKKLDLSEYRKSKIEIEGVWRHRETYNPMYGRYVHEMECTYEGETIRDSGLRFHETQDNIIQQILSKGASDAKSSE